MRESWRKGERDLRKCIVCRGVGMLDVGGGGVGRVSQCFLLRFAMFAGCGKTGGGSCSRSDLEKRERM